MANPSVSPALLSSDFKAVEPGGLILMSGQLSGIKLTFASVARLSKSKTQSAQSASATVYELVKGNEPEIDYRKQQFQIPSPMKYGGIFTIKNSLRCLQRTFRLDTVMRLPQEEKRIRDHPNSVQYCWVNNTL